MMDMDPVLLIIAIRGVVCLFLVWCAYTQFMAGLKLFRKGIDETEESAVIEYKGFKFHSKHVGSLVMVTAAFWALLAVWAIPTYESTRNKVRVGSLETKDLQARGPESGASVSPDGTQAKTPITASPAKKSQPK
jgi:hypothetical protein